MEREQTHRHDMDREAMRLEGNNLAMAHKEKTLGQWLGFSGAVAVVVAGLCVAIWGGSPPAGATIITTTVVGLAGVFVYGRWQENKRQQRGAAETPTPGASDK